MRNKADAGCGIFHFERVAHLLKGISAIFVGKVIPVDVGWTALWTTPPQA